MHRAIAIIALLLSSLPEADADTGGRAELERDVQRLATAIRGATADTAEISRLDLVEARRHLTRALEALEGSVASSDDRDACLAFAADGYARSHEARTARRLAAEGCDGRQRLDIARLLFRAYSRSYAPVTAMKLALERSAERRLRGKRAILEYAIAGYSKSYAASTAVDRAVTETARLERDGLRCLRRANRRRAETEPAFAAMDRAFARCRPRRDPL